MHSTSSALESDFAPSCCRRRTLSLTRCVALVVVGLSTALLTGCPGDEPAPSDGGTVVDPTPLPIMTDGGDVDPDGGTPLPTDGGTPSPTDGGTDVDAGKIEFGVDDGVQVTSGGGAASSANHRVELQVGAPLPRGTASSPRHRLRLAPLQNAP